MQLTKNKLILVSKQYNYIFFISDEQSSLGDKLEKVLNTIDEIKPPNSSDVTTKSSNSLEETTISQTVNSTELS